MRTFGLIPAAGKSERMGRPKLLLPVSGATVLELVVHAVRSAGVADIVVVVAPGAEELAQRARSASAHVVQLATQTPDMRATCLEGLDWIERHLHPTDMDRWLLLPADHPTVRPDVIRALLEAADRNSDATIVVPKFEGRRGHPTLLRWLHVAPIRKQSADAGLNRYIRQCAAQTLEISWNSDEVLRDLDTPADYEQLLRGEA